MEYGYRIGSGKDSRWDIRDFGGTGSLIRNIIPTGLD